MRKNTVLIAQCLIRFPIWELIQTGLMPLLNWGDSHAYIDISGGNARTNYRVTADYRNARGIDLRSDRREYGARANINHTTKDGLFTFSANITPRVIDRNKSANVYSNAIKTIRQCLFMIRNRLMGTIVSQWNGRF